MKKTKVKTIKGWANDSDLFFSPNTQSNEFTANLINYAKNHLKGFKRLPFYKSLRNIHFNEKVIIKGWYWRGSWNNPTKETVAIYYK
jgi:hypothetical protein